MSTWQSMLIIRRSSWTNRGQSIKKYSKQCRSLKRKPPIPTAGHKYVLRSKGLPMTLQILTCICGIGQRNEGISIKSYFGLNDWPMTGDVSRETNDQDYILKSLSERGTDSQYWQILHCWLYVITKRIETIKLTLTEAVGQPVIHSIKTHVSIEKEYFGEVAS